MDNTMDYGADILTLVDDDGVEHQFEVADTMDYEDHQYMALVPVFDEAEELLEDSGELLVLEMVDHRRRGSLQYHRSYVYGASGRGIRLRRGIRPARFLLCSPISCFI